jgi:CRISPR-associated protein (TIGR02584 family)
MKNYLLAVCGLTPQVITETLYALHQEGKRVDAIRILTTRDGKDQCISSLFGAQDGQYFKYLEEYGYGKAAIDFAPRHVIGISDENGREINDIADELDNELFLSACMQQTFELTRDPDSAVYFSLAGGRKTMSACLSLAAQCYGRTQDRIYHVLVSPEFESNREFFYPPRESRLIQLKSFQDGQPYHKETRYAKVILVPMPFFPLRKQLTEKVLKGPEEPATLMLSAVREKTHELIVDLKEGKISWKEVECDMPPSLMALYALLALHKQEADCDKTRCQGCADCYLGIDQILSRQPDMTRLYQRRTGREPVKSGATALDAEHIMQYRSKINRAIRATFGEYEARSLVIRSTGDRPGVRYGIGMERGLIRVVL